MHPPHDSRVSGAAGRPPKRESTTSESRIPSLNWPRNLQTDWHQTRFTGIGRNRPDGSMSGKYAGGPVAVSDALSRGHYRGAFGGRPAA